MTRALLAMGHDVRDDRVLAERICRACVDGLDIDGAAISVHTASTLRQTLYAGDATSDLLGEVEPGESPADAAIREAKEETGLIVAVSKTIGRRVHPKTGRTMIYLACIATHGTDVHVGDLEELAEVRWLSLDEADKLLKGMYEPVREHLGRELNGD